MDERQIRFECLRLAHHAIKDIGGVQTPLTTEEVLKRAKEYSKFTMETK